MDEMTLKEYRRIRRKYPMLPAGQAVLWARGNLKLKELDWVTYTGRHVAVAKTTREGFDIRVVVDYDEYPEQRVEETDKDTGIRNPRFHWTGDPWDTRNVPRFLAVESESTVRDLAKEYRKHSGRNEAWESARESLRDEAEAYMRDDYCEYVLTATASIAGVELGSNSIGGYETDDSVSLERQLESAVSETGIIDEAIAEAQANLEKVTIAQRAIVAKLEAASHA